MTRSMRQVCVIGATLGGLACAISAANHGLHVELIDEGADAHDSPVPVELVPNALRALVGLGVGDVAVRVGFPYHGAEVLDPHGQRIQELVYERLAGARYPAALGIRYADLRRLLLNAASELGVSHILAKATSIEEQGERVCITRGAAVSECDLVILAADAEHPLRSKVFELAQAHAELDQTWWYAMVDRPRNFDRPVVGLSAGSSRVIVVPVRDDVAGIVLCERRRAMTQSPATHLREALQSFAPAISALGQQLSGDTLILSRPTRLGLLDGPWHSGCVLAVGACAHGLPPQFSQATAMDLEDGFVLGELLAASPRRAELLASFSRRRLARVKRVYELAATAAGWDVVPDSGADIGQLVEVMASTTAQLP